MRMIGLIAVSLLAAACTQSVGGDAEPSAPSGSTGSLPSSTAAAPSTGGAPAAGSAIADVIKWVEAGTPADPGEYRVAFRDGVSTELADDIAFTAASGAPHGVTQCITDTAFLDGALTCLVDLDSPPPPPNEGEGLWKPGWTEFSGSAMQVGARHGDPGPFVNGIGAELPEGQSLAFGDFRCRSDASGLLCVNYAFRSAMKISSAGVTPFGCLQPTTAPIDVGEMFSC
ncbi:hypothetical protein JDV09_13775 [Mycobacterium sp. Y57]|uniref:hypothetical protein n=1 Tax=Mycolicibacterium xanthum TaxID=2796469 RepID=UPI001C856457|nr:hypothetical protein [Mycolicibacterium xanthum]MBX7433170.1 hypothetical protein [Mycolicibacterium xanthum]